MAVYVPEIQRDLEKDLQYVTEGDVIGTPANFGTLPTASPSFSFHGKNQRFTYKDTPEGIPIQTIDDEARTSIKKIKSSGVLTVEYDLTDFAYTGDLDWFTKLNTTNFASRTYLFSRNPGTEYYRVLSGCVPIRTTISFPEDNSPVHVSAEILVTAPEAEDTTHGLTTPTFAPAISADVVCPSDGGLDSFDWNAVNYKTKGFELTIEMVHSMVDADDANTIQHMYPSRRIISGSVNVFKKQGADAPHADIYARTLRAMRRVLKPFDSPTSGTRLDLTAVDVAEDEVNNADIRSESTIKNYSFTAGTLTLTELTS